jgi:hypothetical protein
VKCVLKAPDLKSLELKEIAALKNLYYFAKQYPNYVQPRKLSKVLSWGQSILKCEPNCKFEYLYATKIFLILNTEAEKLFLKKWAQTAGPYSLSGPPSRHSQTSNNIPPTNGMNMKKRFQPDLPISCNLRTPLARVGIVTDKPNK